MSLRKRLIRFGIVGGGVAVYYLAAYLLLLRSGMGAFAANSLAFGTAILLQYLGQAAFTFAAPLADRSQIIRFALMVGLGFVTSLLVTTGLAPLLSLSPALAALIVVLFLPVQNYLIMSFWVFVRPDQREKLS